MTYREALRRDPDIAGAYLGLGAALEGQVALDSALDAYKQTLVRDASLWRGWEGVGACLLDGQPARPQAAIAALQRAVQGQPRRGRSRCLLARAFAECRQHREVCAAFQRAADLEAPTVETLTRWARSHWSQNDRHRSLELLRQAVALAPDRLVPLRNLATSLLEVYELSAALAAIAPSPRTMLPRCTFAAISSSSGVASMRRSLRCGARAPSPPPTMLLPAASPSPASTAKLSAPPTSLPPSALRVSTGRPRQQPRSLPSANASTSAICPRTSTATPPSRSFSVPSCTGAIASIYCHALPRPRAPRRDNSILPAPLRTLASGRPSERRRPRPADWYGRDRYPRRSRGAYGGVAGAGVRAPPGTAAGVLPRLPGDNRLRYHRLTRGGRGGLPACSPFALHRVVTGAAARRLRTAESRSRPPPDLRRRRGRDRRLPTPQQSGLEYTRSFEAALASA